MSVTCEICDQGPQDGVSIYRINAKGQPGIWRCSPHLEVLVDRDVKEIVQIIEGATND